MDKYNAKAFFVLSLKMRRHVISQRVSKFLTNAARNLDLHLHAANIGGVFSMMRGRSIAIVGNAQSLFKYEFGTDIDAHDIVIRMNYGYKIDDPQIQGTKTTILAIAGKNFLTSLYNDRPDFEILGLLSNTRIQYPRPRKPYSKYFIYPEAMRVKLANDFMEGGRPSSGAQMINFALLSRPSGISIYGYDFFKSHNFYDQRKEVPHDFAIEAEWASQLAFNGHLIIYGDAFGKMDKRVVIKRPPR